MRFRRRSGDDEPRLDLPELEPPRARHQRLVGGGLLTLALLMLAGAVYLGTDMVEQTAGISRKVEVTESIVDGNVRTLSQVQRELLRLTVLLESDRPGADEVELQEALVSQRVQEGSLSYQAQTLGSGDLLSTARGLARQWETQTLPLVRRAFAEPAGSPTRVRARAQLQQLEKGYNQLVSDGEINRKEQAAKANQGTREMLDRAHGLVRNLVLTFVVVVLLLAVGSLVYLRLFRQRERASAELYELNRELHRYAHVVRSTDNMVVITDARGRVDWVNQAFVRTFGYTLLDLAGRSPGELLQGPGTDPDTVRRMSEALGAGQGFADEVLNYSRDGREIWVALDVSPVHDDHGTLTGFVAVESDNTERRQAEALLRTAKEDAEAVAREKSTFLASMSHEIRTPLNAVLGLTDLLLQTDLDQRQREYVETAYSSGRLLLALVNDILDFSALEAGRLETELRPFRLTRLLDDAMGMFRAEATNRGVGWHLELAADLPTCVRGDETRLRQVLVNLLGNALKFTERGEVELSVRSVPTTTPGAITLEFAVTDTGIGIPSGLVSRLFRPFSQVDASTTRRFGGTGLGLAICRLLVERMGGRIEVVSAEGNGSIFHFRVELEQAAADELEPEAGTVEAVASAAGLARLRVLLAEDDRVNQTVAVHMLRRLGITPEVVGDGRAAVQAVEQGDFDVVLMDVHMPHMDGVMATAMIRETLAADRVPQIVALTANALEGDRERLLAAGMDDYLSKPVQIDTLAAVLRRCAAEVHGPGEEAVAAAEPLGVTGHQTLGRVQLRAPDQPVDVSALTEATGIDDRRVMTCLLGDLANEGQRVVTLVAGRLGAELEDRALAAVRELEVSARACAAGPLARAADELGRRLGAWSATEAGTDRAAWVAPLARAVADLRAFVDDMDPIDCPAANSGQGAHMVS